MTTTPGAFACSRSGWGDTFAARFNLGSQGAADLRYATYLGGANFEVLEESDLALDANGDIYVTGETGSQDFPVLQAHISVNVRGRTISSWRGCVPSGRAPMT